MRVLQVVRYGSIKGGVETYVASLCEGLRAAGHEVTLAYGLEPDPARPEVRDGLLVPSLVEGDGDGADLAAAIERVRPDAIHVHVPDIAWAAQVAAARAPTLLAVHDHRLDCPVGTRYWAGWRRACTVRPGPWCLGYNVVAHCGSLRANASLRPYRSWRRASAAARGIALQAFSEHMRGALALAGFDPARVGVTPYPVPPAPAPVRLEDEDRRPVVLAVGRLTKEKGFRQLLDALEHVAEPAHVVLAGAGHDRPALERRAAQVGRRHRITFPGWLDPAAVAAWRARAAVAVVPSMWPEPFGIAGIEAMAAGTPVVAFDSGGIAEWLEDGVTGRLVPAGDARAMGEAITGLLRDEALRARMGETARERARAAFGLGEHVERVLGLYRDAAR